MSDRIRTVFQVAAFFTVPLFFIEVVHAWRTYRGTRSILDFHRKKSKKYSKLERFKKKRKVYEESLGKGRGDAQPSSTSKDTAKPKQPSQKFGFSDTEMLASPKRATGARETQPMTCPEEVTESETETGTGTGTADDSDDSVTIQEEAEVVEQNEADSTESRPQPPRHPDQKPPKTVRISDALFFPEKSKKPPCKDYYFAGQCPRRNCTESHDINSAVGRLVSYIFRTRDCIDVCQYTITSSFLADAILARHRLGVKVRVITDHDGANQISSQMEKFYNNGIQVRPHRGNGLMHNKYIILDRKVVITGSFNFTTQAIVENFENLTVTDNMDISGRYVSNFERLWERFSYDKSKKK